MKVLSIVHQRDAGPGVFSDVIEARRHGHELWFSAEDAEPPSPLSEYAAVMCFGGAMNVHEEGSYPWIAHQKAALRELLAAGTPLLGVCLGTQLLAAAAGGEVRRASEPEIGWYTVELTEAGRADRVLAAIGETPCAYQWHSHETTLPPDAVELARSAVSLQAYRLGSAAWGIQFHAEVTEDDAVKWAREHEVDPDAIAMGIDPDALITETRERIGEWNELGRKLCAAFLDAAAPGGAGA